MKKISLLILGLVAFYQFSFAQCSVSMSYTIGTNGSVTYSAVATPASNMPAYYWNFYDGTSGYGSNVTHTFTTNGAHMVCVTYIDSVSFCSTSACDTVIITNVPSCHTSFSSTNVDTLYSFTPTSWGGTAPYTYNWFIYDTIGGMLLYSGTAVNPTVVIPTGHYAVVTLTSTDSTGCVSTSTGLAAFGNGANTGGCYASFIIWPDTSNLHSYYGYNFSTGTNLNYFWNWGDGTSSSTAYPSHTYATAGFYTICLSVWSSNNSCSDSICINNFYVNRMGASKTMHSVNILNQNASGINSVIAKSLNVYPNPASTELNVELNSEKMESVKIISLNGQVALQAASLLNKINISELNAGIYFVEVKTNNNIYRTKFVKE